MEVIDYLRKNGIKKLQEEFDISVKFYKDRIILNYRQSTEKKFHPIVKECRGLILRYNPIKDFRQQDFKVLCRSFDRFYNYGENPDDEYFKFEEAVFTEKLDGTLINVYHDGKKWCVATRKTAFGESSLPFTDKSFFEYFTETLMNNINYKIKMINKNITINIPEDFYDLFENYGCKEYTYIFELTGIENRIVTPYDKNKVTLLDCRNKYTGEYITFSCLKSIATKMMIDTVKFYDFNTVNQALESFNKTSQFFEGYVAIIKNENHRRIKIKNPSYVFYHKKRNMGNFSKEFILELLLEENYKEWLKTFPFDEKILKPYIDKYNKLLKLIETDYKKYKDIESQKDYAILVKKKPYANILFSLRKEYKNPEEYLKTISKKQFFKLIDSM